LEGLSDSEESDSEKPGPVCRRLDFGDSSEEEKEEEASPKPCSSVEKVLFY